MFDEVLKEYPSTEQYLKPDSPIVRYSNFESAIYEIQSQNRCDLTSEEEKRVKFSMKEEQPSNREGCNLSLADRVLKSIRLSGNHVKRLIDAKFLLPTSNLC